jgi:hypothetical protein
VRLALALIGFAIFVVGVRELLRWAESERLPNFEPAPDDWGGW